MSRLLVGGEIIRDIHEDFVYAVNVNVFRSDVFQVDIIDFAAHLDVFRHSGRGNDEIDAPSLLLDLEKPCTTWNAEFLQ